MSDEGQEALYKRGYEAGQEELRNSLLNDVEINAMEQTAHLWNQLQTVVGTGSTRKSDLRELVDHIHAIQNCILSQAARRAFPDRFRFLGEVGPWRTEINNAR